MNDTGFAQLAADHQATLRRQAADQRLLTGAPAARRRRGSARRHALAGWHLQSPLTRKTVAAPCP